MEEGVLIWANPSSPHAEGRKARAALEDARERIKAALGWDGELIFTSGASEALAIGLGRAQAGARFVGQTEHEAVLSAAPDAERLPVRGDGALDMDELTDRIEGAERALVAVQTVNSETGNRQDIPAIAATVHASGGLLLADCAQSAGRYPLPHQADMVVVSAHKFGGPVGIGALLVRDYAMLAPSGGQERGYRRGTENLPGALGMAAALDACSAGAWVAPSIAGVLEGFAAEARALGGEWLDDRLADPVPHICALAMPGVSGSAQLMRFDMRGFAVSQGSACSSGSLRPSHVLQAMGIDAGLAARTIRVSFGWSTTAREVGAFAEAWLAMAREAAEQAA